MIRWGLWGAFALGVFGACAAELPLPEERLPKDGPLFLERIFTVRDPGGLVLVGGHDEAAPPGTRVEATDASGSVLGEATADAHGRFELALGAVPATEIRIGPAPGAPTTFAVRDPRQAREAAVQPPLGGAGSVPNDLVVVGAPESPRGVVVRSGDDAVSVFDLRGSIEDGATGVRLPSLEGGAHPAYPWFAAALDGSGAHLAVTAFGHDRVYLIDAAAGVVESTLAFTRPVTPVEPFVLARPFDVDGDGTAEGEVTQFWPRAPQGVVADAERIYVAFSGFLAARVKDQGPVYLPGVLAAWRRGATDPEAIVILPDFDPQELRLAPSGELLVTSSGILDVQSGGVVAVTPGSVLVIDPATLQPRARFDLGAFAPSSALPFEDRLWVASLARGELLALERMSGKELTRLKLGAETTDSVFRLIAVDGGLIAAASFNTDRLHFVDARTGALDPAPFFEPLVLGPGRPIFDGLQIIAQRPGRRGVDYVGPDLFALAGVASRITPIELRKVLGP